jgi:hypothetical protein
MVGIVGANAILNGKGYQDAKHGKSIARGARRSCKAVHHQLDVGSLESSYGQSAIFAGELFYEISARLLRCRGELGESR